MDINNHELTSQTLTKVTDVHSRDLLNMLINNIREKDTEIVNLRNRVTDLELRVAEQERYTSKDCVLLKICHGNVITNRLLTRSAYFFNNI